MTSSLLIIFIVEELFFFQAEDGIRDGTVTGVQTCALPIWFCAVPRSRPTNLVGKCSDFVMASKDCCRPVISPSSTASARRTSRSEERRVGKECRSRGVSYDQKKKNEKKVSIVLTFVKRSKQ